MKLKLSKPIAFIDLETTGVNVGADRIVEIAIIKIHPDGNKEQKEMRLNPTIPIPKASTDIHGIKDEDVRDKPTFNDVAKELFAFLDKCDLGGYNSNKFDVPLLVEEFLRAEVDFDISTRRLVDVQNIFHKMEQRTLVAAYQFYCNKKLENAHSALADIEATYDVLEAQLEKYTELEPDVSFLHTFSKRNQNVDLAGRVVLNDNNIAVFNFGKHKNKSVAETFKKEPSYYSWMMKGDFTRDTKKVITKLRLETFNQQ